MTPSALIILANGFEEIEAITVIDILRRASVEVVVAGLSVGIIEASRKTRHQPDQTLEDTKDRLFDMIILPGGQPGTHNLKNHPLLRNAVLRHHQAGKWVAAICAAPTILQDLGILKGHEATSHPSVQNEMTDPSYRENRVLTSGKIITSRSAGTAMEFAFHLVGILCGPEKIKQVNEGVLARL